MKTLYGNSYKESHEGAVNLSVGCSRRQQAALLRMELLFGRRAVFDIHKNTCLGIEPEVTVGIFKAETFESVNTVPALDIHNHAAEVEKQIAYHSV